MSYIDIYKKRVNRDGNDYKTRILTQRQEVFNRRLERSVYRVDFEYNGDIYPGTFERRKQDETEVTHFLFTKTDLIIPNGTIIFFPVEGSIAVDDNETGEHDDGQAWMVYWLEETTAKGYNRYVMLKMTHYFTWVSRDGTRRGTYAYVYGQEDNMLKDEIRSRSRMDSIYAENLKMSFLICPTNPDLKKNDYFEKTIDGIIQPFVVTGFDVLSTPGVEYVTIDPVYEYDKSPLPAIAEEETPASYWLNGGVVRNGN